MLEKELVRECQEVAKALNAFLAVVGQRKAKGSGSTPGFPDLVLLCNGEVVLIEVKRPATADHPKGYLSLGQSAFLAGADEQGVTVHVVDTVEQFTSLINWCRRPRGVAPRSGSLKGPQ